MAFCSSLRNMVLASGAVIGLSGCVKELSDPAAMSPVAPSDEPGALTGGGVSAMAMPNAVFRTTPVAAADGTIFGDYPLTVQFNNCQSRPADPDDNLRFTYDFDNDGTIDAFGHCRWEHTYTGTEVARVCVSDRRGNDACRNWNIVPSPILPVPTGGRPSAGSPRLLCGALGLILDLNVTDPEGDAITWTASVAGSTLLGPPSGGPARSGTVVSVTFDWPTGPGLVTVRIGLTDAQGNQSLPVSHVSRVCGIDFDLVY